jgi:riboflavin transporter FmnP
MNEEVFAKRRPYVCFVLVSALIFLAFALFWPIGLNYDASSLPFLVVLFCLIMYAGVWAEALRGRLKAVGWPHSRWLIVLYGLFVYTACFLLSFYISKGRLIALGLFVLLNMPLAFLKEKSGVSVALPVE